MLSSPNRFGHECFIATIETLAKREREGRGGKRKDVTKKRSG